MESKYTKFSEMIIGHKGGDTRFSVNNKYVLTTLGKRAVQGRCIVIMRLVVVILKRALVTEAKPNYNKKLRLV